MLGLVIMTVQRVSVLPHPNNLIKMEIKMDFKIHKKIRINSKEALKSMIGVLIHKISGPIFHNKLKKKMVEMGLIVIKICNKVAKCTNKIKNQVGSMGLVKIGVNMILNLKKIHSIKIKIKSKKQGLKVGLVEGSKVKKKVNTIKKNINLIFNKMNLNLIIMKNKKNILKKKNLQKILIIFKMGSITLINSNTSNNKIYFKQQI